VEDTRPWWRQPTGSPFKRVEPARARKLAVGVAVFYAAMAVGWITWAAFSTWRGILVLRLFFALVSLGNSAYWFARIRRIVPS